MLRINKFSVPSMARSTLLYRAPRLVSLSRRPLSTTTCLQAEPAASDNASNPFAKLNARVQDTAKAYRKFQLSKPLGPHLTNTTSTIANTFPSIGSDKPPPELLSSVDKKEEFKYKDGVPENTERMTGGTQDGGPSRGPNGELDVGQIEGGTFKVEPLRREGEDLNTLRARLLCPSTILHCTRAHAVLILHLTSYSTS